MKKLMCNNVISVGDFCGPDIEEGTFHEEDTAIDINHESKTQKCPCPPIGFHGSQVSDDSDEDNGKNPSNND